MAKKDIRICRYIQCKHKTKEINIITDEYVNKGSMYYHKDCYKAKVNGEWKDEKTKRDLQTIKELWITHINNTVVYSALFRVLNELLQRGIDSDYLLFVMQYCIMKKLNLNYPNGFKYFVDKKEIKDAYAKKQLKDNGYNKESFIVVEDDKAPSFTAKLSKPKGFDSILKKKNE